ncbi:MAG: YvcK family protein [Tissierellia bacterium]|nr:YvcK family protein [Tissierellia bacterium]
MEKKISVIGGGTGISSLLRGLKKYTKELSAIVTMSDDGGGSGILREDFQMLPPGDVRNCLVALSNTEPTMKNLLQYRFQSGSLKKQNVGNILIAALYNIYGSFDQALLEMSNVFNITGNIYPVTLEDCHLVAELENKDKVIGESIIPKMSYKLNSKIVEITMFPQVPKGNPRAMDAISQSDIIVLGPGSLYTSIIPNLLVEGICDRIAEAKGHVAYIANAMTQRGETPFYSVTDHINAIEYHSYSGIIDICMVNNFKASPTIYKQYENYEDSLPIFLKREEKNQLKQRGIQVVEGPFVEIKDGKIRHDGERIGESLWSIFEHKERL